MAVKKIPAGFHTITPHLTLSDAKKALEFYQKAFGAEEVYRTAIPDGRILHAEIVIGDSHVFLNDDFPEFNNSTKKTIGDANALQLYVEDADKVFQQAIDAGAKVEMKLDDMFWGDRYGVVSDPFGYRWAIATHQEDVSPEEMDKRTKKMFSK